MRRVAPSAVVATTTEAMLIDESAVGRVSSVALLGREGIRR